MPPRRLALLALVTLFALASPSLAQVGEQEEAADFSMTGTVKAVDPAKSMISLRGANQEGGTFEVDPKARLKNEHETIQLKDVKPGWQVVVNGDVRGDVVVKGDVRGGRKVVTYLEVVDTP